MGVVGSFFVYRKRTWVTLRDVFLKTSAKTEERHNFNRLDLGKSSVYPTERLLLVKS